jgi:hypothetical protein
MVVVMVPRGRYCACSCLIPHAHYSSCQMSAESNKMSMSTEGFEHSTANHLQNFEAPFVLLFAFLPAPFPTSLGESRKSQQPWTKTAPHKLIAASLLSFCVKRSVLMLVYLRLLRVSSLRVCLLVAVPWSLTMMKSAPRISSWTSESSMCLTTCGCPSTPTSGQPPTCCPLRPHPPARCRCGLWYQVSTLNNETQIELFTELEARPEPRVMAWDIECTKMPLK